MSFPGLARRIGGQRLGLADNTVWYAVESICHDAKVLTCAWILLAVSLCLAAENGVVETTFVSMRDGVRLATDVYYPAAATSSDDRRPVLVYRSPYGRAGAKGDARHLASHGYVVVAQDVRGRFDSEGEFYPFLNEGPDGFDTIEWASKQPWSNGKVGTFGASYLAWDQYLASMYRPPHLVAMFTLVGGASFYEDFAYPGGVPNLSWPIWMVKSAQTSRFGDERSRAALGRILDNPAEWLRLPAEERLTLFEQFPLHAKYYRDFYAHPTLDAYWKQKGFYTLDSFGEFKDVPTVFLTGWYDYFADGVLANFKALKAEQRSPHKLIVGPWPHPTGESSCGDAFFGNDAAVNQRELMTDWFDHWMKGAEPRLIRKELVQYFRMGGGSSETKAGKVSHGGRWLQSAAWPPRVSASEMYFLRDSGKLSRDAASDEGSRTLFYDPNNPVPTLGGRYGMGGWSPNCSALQVCSQKYLGCTNEKPIAKRDDVLSFQSQPLASNTDVTGAPRAVVWVSSDAPDTDLFAKLIDVYPDGRALLISEGQLRMRYRNGYGQASLLKPGELYQVRIQLGSVSNLFAKGHRIRLDITSSNFPHFEPNPNTGAAIGVRSEPRIARNTVHFSRKYQSGLELPVVKQ